MGFVFNLLTFPVLGPMGGIHWLATKVTEAAEGELLDEDRVRGELLELQMRLEMAEISEEEYDEQEKVLVEWLNAIRDNQHCIYDPVCYERESSCHACTHLPETSCRYFNLNLSRSLLFGGPDPQLGHIHFGYFDLSLQE